MTSKVQRQSKRKLFRWEKACIENDETREAFQYEIMENAKR